VKPSLTIFLSEGEKRSRKPSIIKTEPVASEDDLPPSKRSKNATTTKSPRKGSDGFKSSDEDVAPRRRLPPVDSSKTTTKKGKGRAGMDIPTPPLKTAKGVKSSSASPLAVSKSKPKARTVRESPPILPCESTDSELSAPEPPSSKSKSLKPKSKARAAKKSSPVSPGESTDSELSLSEAPSRKSRKSKSNPKAKARIVKKSPSASSCESIDSELSLSETASRKSKMLKPESGAGTPKKSPTSRKPKKRVTASDTEAVDRPKGSATRKALDSDSETEKPSLAPAAGREMIKKLSKSVPPAYPDWVAGKPTPYAALVTTFNLLESTTKRLEKISHASRFLRQVLRLSPDELLLVIHLMINKLAADFEGVEMGIGESLLMKAIGESCGRSMERIREDQRECGDLGLVAMKSRNKQLTIFPPQPLTIAVVHKGLLNIAKVKGEGGQGRKVSAIRKLLAAAQGDEAKFLIRGLEGKLRLGLADRTVLVSLSSAMITHEQELSGKMPTTAMLDQSELNLRSVYRFVTIDGL